MAVATEKKISTDVWIMMSLTYVLFDFPRREMSFSGQLNISFVSMLLHESGKKS